MVHWLLLALLLLKYVCGMIDEPSDWNVINCCRAARDSNKKTERGGESDKYDVKNARHDNNNCLSYEYMYVYHIWKILRCRTGFSRCCTCSSSLSAFFRVLQSSLRGFPPRQSSCQAARLTGRERLSAWHKLKFRNCLPCVPFPLLYANAQSEWGVKHLINFMWSKLHVLSTGAYKCH